MSKIGKFWLFGKQEEPAEDFDADYDNIYYEDRTTTSVADDSIEGVTEKMPLFGESATYGADVSEVQVEEEPEEIEEPLYKVVFAPDSYRDSAEIVDCFKIGRVCVIDTVELSREDFVRMLDYVMGAVQALDGELVKLDRDTVCVLPYGVEKDTDIDALEEAVDEEAEEDGKDAD